MGQKKSGEIEKCFELKKDENTTYYLWYAAEVAPTGKFIVLTVYIRREEIFKINNLSFLLSKQDKEEQIKSKVKKKK